MPQARIVNRCQQSCVAETDVVGWTPSPAVESAIANATVLAERIMARIDSQWSREVQAELRHGTV